MASRGSKIALASTSLFAVSTIVFVHFQQQAEKTVQAPPPSPFLSIFFHPPPHKELTKTNAQAMHQGVVRDVEQQRVKRERQLDFDLQRRLEAEYRETQNVCDVTTDEGRK